MATFNKEKGFIELTEEDEKNFTVHFKNARRAWRARSNLQDGLYQYILEENGVLGKLSTRAQPEYFWHKGVLEKAPLP